MKPEIVALPSSSLLSSARSGIACLSATVGIRLFIALFATSASAQSAISFVNPGLEGTTSGTVLPSGWAQVPFGTPHSQATTVAAATADTWNSSRGTPQDGDTFVSGLHMTAIILGNNTYQEGIRQTVSGFTVGETYEFSFYQSVIKQANARDESGSWRVYANGDLIATTEVSTSTVPYNDINKIWDLRTLTFTAQEESIQFDFLPWDDDSNITESQSNTSGALRMGIDSFSDITVVVPEPSGVLLFGFAGSLALLGRRSRR